MTAHLTASQYTALCADKAFVVRNVEPKGASYKVDYDYADTTHTDGNQSPFQPVLGSVSQEGKQGDGGKGVPDSHSQGQPADAPASSGSREAERPMEKGCNSIGSIMAQSTAMGRYLDLDEPEPSPKPDAVANTSRGVEAGDGGNEGNKHGLLRPPDMDARGQAEISSPKAAQEPAQDNARGDDLRNCPTCSAPLESNGECAICSALAGLKAVCDKKRRDYHLMKSGLRHESE